MNLFKLFTLTAAIGLVGCANTPLANSSNERVAPLSSTNVNRVVVPVAENKAQLTNRETAESPQATPAPSASTAAPALTPITPSTTTDFAAGARNVVSLATPSDLWERIRRGYAIPNLDSSLVRDREQWYASRPDYIFRMTQRSKKYLYHIVEELEMRNMPTELALLPFIESAFNPQAVSGAKAAGIWQFMPATGKYFELKQNVFRDDRRDVLASTRAALDYLNKLYGMFGDWHLALAAYNWGEGNVGRSIGKNQRMGLGVGYLDLNMPMETRMYVPKLQAVKNIVAAPAAFNAQLPLIENHPYFQSVAIRRDIDVVLAAKLAEVPLEDFKALNPSINKPVILAAGTPTILLPWDNAEVFQSNLETYGGARMASWTVWVVPTTMRPAEVAKRVGMSEAELRSVNNVPARVVIRAGSSLLVPRSARVLHDVTEKIADTGQMSVSPEVVLKRMVVTAGKADTVASIAHRYKVSSAHVAQWNKVSISAKFSPRQQVLIYTSARSEPRAKTNRSKAPNRQLAKKARAQGAKR